MGVKRGRGTDSVQPFTFYHKSVGAPQLTPQKYRRQLKTTILKSPVPVDYSFPASVAGTNGDANRVFVDLNQNDDQYEGATLTTIDEELLAIDELISYQRTAVIQTETILEQLVPETQPPPTLNALVTTMSQEALGNGKSALTFGTVPQLFTDPSVKIEIVGWQYAIPRQFRGIVPVQESSHLYEAAFTDPLPAPVLGFGELSHETSQTNMFVRKDAIQYRNLGLLPVSVTDYKMTGKKQVETETATLRVGIAQPLSDINELTEEATAETIGDGTWVETIGTVPVLFTEQSYEKQIPDVIPEKFRVLIPTSRQSVLSAGIATDPTLGTGELRHTTEQINVFTKRDQTEFRSTVGLPVSLVEYKMTGKSQVATVTMTFAAGLQTLSPNELTVDASVDNLGNNTSLKNVGVVPSLFTEPTYEAQIPDLIPEKFRPIVPTRRTSLLSAGTATPPTLATGELSHTSEQVNAFVVRDTSQFRSTVGLPVSLTEYELTREKQISTIVATLATGLQTITGVNELTQDAKVDNLGNGLSLLTEGAVPALFVAESFGKTIPDVIPEKFRVLVPTSRHEYLNADTSANDRALGTGELSYTSAQVNAFVVREQTEFRSTVGLPVSLPESRMTQEQQVASVVATLAVGLQTLSPDSTWVEANVDNLGNNTSLATVATVPSVFPKDSYTKSVLNLIPEKLRALIPITETTVESAIPPDISTDPTLLTGELERTESRVAVFKKRIAIKKIGTITLPVVKHDHGFTEQNGGDTTTTTYSLNLSGTYSVETGQFVIKSELVDLGNGYEVLTTEKADHTTAWPLLHGQDYDERLDLILPYTTQVKLAGSDLNTARTDIKPHDQWKQEERTIDITNVATVLNAYVLSYPSKINIDMPDRLVSVAGIIETAFGEGANSEDGTFSAAGSFSVSMALRASAQSSATLIPDVAPGIVQFWGNNIDCTHYIFFLPQPVTPAQVVTKINALVSGTVSPWPKFNPQTVTITARGEKASLQATASSQGSLSSSTSGNSSTTAGGTGFSREHSLNLKTIRISPTIHPLLTVSEPTSQSQSISVDASAEASGLGPAEDSSANDTVAASITPTSIPATTGATAWPTTGLFLYKVDAQPYRYGYVQFHVIIVDAAAFPSS